MPSRGKSEAMKCIQRGPTHTPGRHRSEQVDAISRNKRTSSSECPFALNMRDIVFNEGRIIVAEAREFLLHPLERVVGHVVKIDKASARALHPAQEFVELERHDPRFPVLG